LNHRHICTLHDIGHEGDIDFLVLEYFEGETLADRVSAIRHAAGKARPLEAGARVKPVSRPLARSRRWAARMP
jgi:hypothetical protein